MGKISAEEIKQKLVNIPNELQKFENYIMMCGFGNIEILELGDIIKLNVRKNHIIELSKEMYKKESKICNFYRGIYNAFIDNLFMSVKLKELTCICKGNTRCSFEAKKDV